MFLSNLTRVTWLLILAGVFQTNSADQRPNPTAVSEKVDLLLKRLEEGVTIKEFDDSVYDIVVAIDGTYLDKTSYEKEISKRKLGIGKLAELAERTFNESDNLGQTWKQLKESISHNETSEETVNQLVERIKDVLFNVASLLKSMSESPDHNDTILSHRTPRQSGEEECEDPCEYDLQGNCFCFPDITPEPEDDPEPEPTTPEDYEN